LTEKQESRTLQKKIISKMDERKKEGTPIKRLRNKLKEPQTSLKWNIFSPYVKKSWNFKEQGVTI